MQRKYSKESFLDYLNENTYSYSDPSGQENVLTNEKVTNIIFDNNLKLESGYRTMSAIALLQLIELEAKKSLNIYWINNVNIKNTNTGEHYDWIVPFLENCFNDFHNKNHNENDNLKQICMSGLKNKHQREEFVKTFQDAKTIISQIYKNATEKEKEILNRMKSIYNSVVVNEVSKTIKASIEFEQEYMNTYDRDTQEVFDLDLDYKKNSR